MTIAFRLKYALGLIPSADQLDARWDKLTRMRNDLNQMERSVEMKQFEDLKSLIASIPFQQHKREVESLRFRESKEEMLMQEQKLLANSSSIKNYRNISGSDKLKRLGSILKGAELQRFTFLKKEVESPEFANRKSALKKKEFVKSPDFILLKEYRLLQKSSDISFWRKFGHSERYYNYLKTVDSDELKRLEELEKLTSSDEFKQRVAYLKDKKRFLKSEDYKNILSFNALDKSKFMTDYRKLKQARELDFFKKWSVSFDENFEDKKLDTERWQPENWWGYKLLGASFSQHNEKQGYNGLKNIELSNNTLSIWAKKEKVAGSVWNASLGLMPNQHDYSSAILNSAEFFRIREGVLEAKVRFRKDATIISAFSLTGEKPFPQIDLFRSTKKGVGLGIIEKPGDGAFKYKKLNGLNDGKYHIFRLELFGDQLVWRINGKEVYSNSISLKEPLFFHLLTSLHGEVNEHLLPHRFEIDWIRCFSKNIN
jgi:hypothetical protein